MSSALSSIPGPPAANAGRIRDTSKFIEAAGAVPRGMRHRTLLESARWFLHGGRHDAKLVRLTASPLARGMSVRQLVTLAATADIVTLQAGTTAVIGPGGRFVHQVLSGRVAAAEGGSILDVFAAGARLSPGNQGGVILALEDSELIVLSDTF